MNIDIELYKNTDNEHLHRNTTNTCTIDTKQKNCKNNNGHVTQKHMGTQKHNGHLHKIHNGLLHSAIDTLKNNWQLKNTGTQK